MIALFGGSGVPGVNESHYIAKAKHAWDSSFGAGDLFLESHDAHFLATASAGFMCQFLPMLAVAWIGRGLSWALLAWAWLKLSDSLRMPPAAATIALASWYLATSYGHWAGEWAIGGFEAKSVSYPLAILGIAAALEGRWPIAWVWLGGAVAWHPVVGGWVGLTVGAIWLWELRSKRRAARADPSGDDWRGELSRNAPWLAAGAAIGMVGVWPALAGLGGVERAGNVVASQVHVFLRLSHHMLPRTFAPERHWAAVGSLLFLVAVAAWRYTSWSYMARSARLENEPHDDELSREIATRRLLGIAWMSVLFAVVGLGIDRILCEPRLMTFRPELASKLLRFYWFRWADIAVPLGATLVFWQLALPRLGQSTEPSIAREWAWPSRLALLMGFALTLGATVWQVRLQWANSVPEADRLVVNLPIGLSHAAEGSSRFTAEDRARRYVDWLAVCDWIRNNSPENSLWFTPKHQQTFKWHAQRAEVVCWKDVPQDNESVLEWYSRIERCEPPRDASGRMRSWTTDELLALSREYGFRWVLLDRAVQTEPPLLEIMYPVEIENPSFAVFRIGPDGSAF